MPVILEPGLMGSIYDPETNWWMKHRIGIYMGVTSFCAIMWAVMKAFIPALQSKAAPVTKIEALKLIATYVIIGGLYVTNIGDNYPRFPETWWLEHRMSLMLVVHTFYTAVYYVSKKVLASLGVESSHCSTQAANVVRVLVKLSMFIYWVLPGEIFVPVTTHPLALTRERYESTHHVAFAVNSLYIWEVMFRELKPVNVIHHGMACIGLTSFSEWQNVLEPARTNTSLPLLGSLIEGVCCLGSMCYRFMPRGKVLQRIMTALTFFILISYNALLVAYVVLLHAYVDLYSFGYGYICMPALAIFTYPAQMNMAKVYWGMAKRAGSPKASSPAVVAKPVEPPRQRRQQA